MKTKKSKYDILVIGGGHAGCEAAFIASKMGAKTALVSMDLKKLAAMPCNPAIGGPGKGHLVREIGVLGGIMAHLADKTLIQIRMLNTSKGPAVQAYRAQIEKEDYSRKMLKLLKKQRNLRLLDDEAVKIKNDKNFTIKTKNHGEIEAQAVIVATGTFLNGEIYLGNEKLKKGGRIDAPSSDFLSSSLKKMKLDMGRLKTGTPPRVLKQSVDTSKAIEQTGTEGKHSFSLPLKQILPLAKQIPCFLSYTNNKTHQIIQDHKKDSPVISGTITEEAPRHCPSLDRKVLKFPQREKHPIFIEPMGRKSNLLYLQGCSISFPIEIQEKILKTIPALKNVKIEIPGYAIVYDYVKPYELKSNLETKKIKNLFLAGQINGTSGYEEAAAQGLMAGINAVLKIKNQKPFILERNEAYIGVLIDDLITKIHKEPYRIYTGSAEYRLLLRQSNADIRLAKYASSLGLIKEKDYRKAKEKESKIENIIEEMKKTKEKGKSLWKLLKQPEIKINDFIKDYSFFKKIPQEIIDEIETEIKYEDYIKRQEESVKKDKSMEDKSLDSINYDEVTTIRNLAKERLKEVKPNSIGQASRIAGVTSADITALLIYLKKISKS